MKTRTTNNPKHVSARCLPGGRPARWGGAVLEMGITLSLLLSLTFGSIEFGDAFFKKNTMQGAAREGARAAIVYGATTATVQAAVQTVMTASGISSSNYTVTITDTNGTTLDPSTAVAGTAVKVTVSAEWRNIGLRPLGVLSSTKVINGVAVMRKES